MTTRCIIRNLLLSSATLALVLWPAFSRADTITANVVSSTSSAPFFIASQAYPTIAAYDTAATNAGKTPGSFVPTSPGALAYTGTLDITNNVLIIQNDNYTDALASYQNVYNMIKSGSAGGAYTGTGITSSYVEQEPFGYVGVGVELNDGQLPVSLNDSDPAYTTFDGVPVNTNSVIVMYTWIGDSALIGPAWKGSAGFLAVENNFNNLVGGNPFGWANGEIEYNGAADYLDIENEFGALVAGTQPGPDEELPQFVPPPLGFTSTDAQAFGSAQTVGVPEPAAFVMASFALLLGGFGSALLRARRASVSLN